MNDNDLDFQYWVQINLDLAGRSLKAKGYLFEKEKLRCLRIEHGQQINSPC